MEKYVVGVSRFGTFGVFFGHGCVALTSLKWVYLLNFWGFETSLATKILPYIGILDILVAFCILLKPIKIVVYWAIFWAFLTALSRPLAGDPIYDFIERFANWCLPLVLLICLYYRKKTTQYEKA